MRRTLAGASAQRGIALLTALVLVAIAAVLATAIAFASAMSARRATHRVRRRSEPARRRGCRSDGGLSCSSSRSECTPGCRSISPGRRPTVRCELLPGVTLEFAQLEDQQGKFNINNLAPSGGATERDCDAQFQQLLALVGLETKWAPLMADWIDADNEPNFPDGAEDSVYLTQTPPYRAAEPAGHQHLRAAGAAGLRPRSLQSPGAVHHAHCRREPRSMSAPPPGVVLDALSGKIEYSSRPAAAAGQRRQADGLLSDAGGVSGQPVDQAGS